MGNTRMLPVWAQNEFIKLKNILGQQRIEYCNLQNQLCKAMDQIRKQNADIKQLITENANYVKQIKRQDDLRHTLNNALNLVNEQSKKIKNLNVENASHERQIEKLKSDMKAESNLAEEVHELSKAKTQISGQNKKINQLVNENASYADEIEHLKDQLAKVSLDETTIPSDQKLSKKKRNRRS